MLNNNEKERSGSVRVNERERYKTRKDIKYKILARDMRRFFRDEYKKCGLNDPFEFVTQADIFRDLEEPISAEVQFLISLIVGKGKKETKKFN